MGSGYSKASRPKVMTEEEYLSSKGYSFMGYSEAGMHISSQHVSDRQKKQMQEMTTTRAREYDMKRAELRQEYRELVKQGKMRTPTTYEQALKTAQGNPDNPAVQAARRLVEKYKQKMKNKK